MSELNTTPKQVAQQIVKHLDAALRLNEERNLIKPSYPQVIRQAMRTLKTQIAVGDLDDKKVV